jgi:diacylglycerol kinase family enzyme
MRLTLLLNRNAGTLRTLDPDQALADLAEIFRARGHEVTAEALEGAETIAAIERNCTGEGPDVIVVGGGDGTISAAAAAVAKCGKTLGILPLGTMNLFARALAIPLDMIAAAEALASAETVAVDIAEVNGRFFVHHVTLGLHARMILMRTRLDYASRMGKIWASAKAWWMALRDPPKLIVHIRADGLQFQRRTAAVLVTNNPLGEGHIPYADDPSQGMFGLYVANSPHLGDLLSMALRMLFGSFAANPLLDNWEAGEVDIALAAPTVRASVDGELVTLDTPLRCRLHHRGLNVLKPRSEVGAADASRL